jgi:4'-phosphopantetheinyl transferase
MPHLRRFDLEISGLDRALIDPWLSSKERSRFDMLRSQRRRRDWLAGRLAAKALIIEYQRVQSGDDLKPAEIEVVYGSHGEPQALVRGERLEGIALSIAHSFGRGVAGLSELQMEGHIGVDIEYIRPVHPKLKERLLSVEEFKDYKIRFAKSLDEGLILYWTLKEAALKALRPMVTPPPRMHQLRVRLAEREGQARIALPPRSRSLEAHYLREGDFYIASVLAPVTSRH